MIALAEPPAIIRKQNATQANIAFPGLRPSVYDNSLEKNCVGIFLNFAPPLVQIRAKISRLHEWVEGWNGHDVAAPKKMAVNRALIWVQQMYSDVNLTTKQWQEPHVTASEDGDVLLEWWNGDKGLSIYISENSVSYLKDWGPNIAEEMEDGVVASSEKQRQLWHWLMD